MPQALSTQTASFLLWLVNQQAPSAGAPDFAQAAESIMTAQAELKAIIEAQAEPIPVPL
jgi:hypothetical protein